MLLDLSHDLDFLSWMLGSWRRVAAIGGQMSSLEISSDDVFSLLYESDRCSAISVQLNYLDRVGRRIVIVNTSEHTFEADLIRNTLAIDREKQQFTVDRDTTYREMHTAILSGEPGQACTVSEAMDTLALCDAAKTLLGMTVGGKMKRVCTVCARAGSKGVLVSLRLLRGLPLVAHGVRHAALSGLFDQIAVSSDSPEILAVAKNIATV